MLSTTNSNTWGKKSLQTLFFFILIAQLCFPQLNQQTAKTNLRKTNDLSKQQYRLHPNFNSDVEGRLSNKYLSSNTLNQLHSGIEKRISPQSQIYVIDTAYILQVDDGNLPADTIRYLFSFNASAKRTLELQQRLIDGTWVDSYRRTNTYDAQGNMLTDLRELWENNQWVNDWRGTYTYDAQGNMLTDLLEYWENNQWVNYSRRTYTYDAQGNMLTYLWEYWEDNQWVNAWRYTYTYNAQGNMLTDLAENWENNQWVNDGRGTYTYDAQGNMLTDLLEYWENNQWVNYSRRTYTYDAQGNMLTNLTELWENSQWVNGWRYTYTYNAQGNLASIWFHAGLNSSWVPANLNTFSGYEVYDMAGNEYRFWGHNVNFIYKLIVTEVLSEKTNVPEYFTLQQNFPNPFNPRTKINYAIPKESFVMIKVYDMLGREIKTLVNEEKTAGNYSVSFNAENLSSGIYFYTIKADAFVQTKKMVLLK